MKRCLIVDDSSVIRKVAKRILGGPELSVAEADSGADAIEKSRIAMPDYIIVDGLLPDMTVEEFIDEIRTLVPNGKMPKISVCMVELDVPRIMRAKRAGAVNYCMKPFTRPQLMERFRELSAA
jgi:two-component system, chemotaxis family, chemotaxis protein CheY